MTEAALARRRRVIGLALPLVLSTLSQTLLTQVDRIMVGRMVGSESLAAMGSGGIIYLVVFLIVSCLFVGVQALTARRYGEKQYTECGRILDKALLLAAVLGAVAGLAGVAFATPITKALNHDPNIGELAGRYLEFRWGGIITIAILWVFKGFYFGVGITRLDMFMTLAMNVLNVLLNWMFIGGHLGAPELGLPGAGLASVCATALSVVVYVAYTFRAEIRHRYRPFHSFALDLDMLTRIIRFSGPRAMQAAAFGGWIYFFKIIENQYGETALAATSAVWGFCGIPVLVSIAFGMAAATLVGHELGAKRPNEADAIARQTLRLGIGLNAVLAFLEFFFPRLILSIYTEDQAVIEAGVGPLRLLALFQCVDAGGIILARVLASAGCARYVMVSEFAVILAVMLPAAAILSGIAPDNLTVIWLAWVLYVIAWYGAMATKFARGRWKTVEV